MTPRVLLIAESANPDWTSVPLVGWSHAQALSKITHSHLVTQIRNREAILRAGLREGIDFTAIDSEPVAKRIWQLSSLLRGGQGKGWTTLTALNSLSYYYFEHLLWKQFGQRLQNGEFDLVHRLTPLSPTTPSILGPRLKALNIPFILGPLNGGVPWPKAFDSARRREREYLSYIRSAYKLLPGYHSTLRDSSLIFAGSKDTLSQIPRQYHGKTVYLPENAIDPTRFTLRRTRTATTPIRILYLGRLVPYKGADMLIEAAAPLIRAGQATLEIVGDGPMMQDLKSLIARESLTDQVPLKGWIDHKQIQQTLIEADLLGFPSIREFGGGVVLEAMAVGLPPLIVNYGGPAELITPDSAFSVEMGTRLFIIQQLRQTLQYLATHPQKIDAAGQAALRLAHEQYTWDAKAAFVAQQYERLLSRRVGVLAHREPQSAPIPAFT